MGKKVSFVAVFTDITRKGALSEEASIHPAIKTALREIQKSEDKRWVTYTDSLSSMLAIEDNKKKSSHIKSDMTY